MQLGYNIEAPSRDSKSVVNEAVSEPDRVRSKKKLAASLIKKAKEIEKKGGKSQTAAESTSETDVNGTHIIVVPNCE